VNVFEEQSRVRSLASNSHSHARAKGMTQLARATGLGRERLYKALSPQGNPEFATVLKVLCALGMTLKAIPISNRSKKSQRQRAPRAADI
jgi:probable addiction module antidote protein